MATVALMAPVVLRSDLTRWGRLQASYEICAAQMHVCPTMQANWALFAEKML